jgi:hypothetical protein
LAENKQIFASKYKLVLPTPEELKAELEREIHFLKKKVEENQDLSTSYELAAGSNKEA